MTRADIDRWHTVNCWYFLSSFFTMRVALSHSCLLLFCQTHIHRSRARTVAYYEMFIISRYWECYNIIARTLHKNHLCRQEHSAPPSDFQFIISTCKDLSAGVLFRNYTYLWKLEPARIITRHRDSCVLLSFITQVVQHCIKTVHTQNMRSHAETKKQKQWFYGYTVCSKQCQTELFNKKHFVVQGRPKSGSTLFDIL